LRWPTDFGPGSLIAHSRRTFSIIHQNIVLSLAVKFVVVSLAFAGHASLWAAIAADMGVSLVVIVNAFRLLQPKSHTGIGALAYPS
jgi:Zn2+/Cd2+-exporting ATPase